MSQHAALSQRTPHTLDPLERELRRMEVLARLKAVRALRRAVSASTRRPVVRANMSHWF